LKKETTMKISSKDFRVREGGEVDLRKWPTIGDPVYKSREQYQDLLRDHVTRLSSQQQLLYASNRYAILLVFQAADAAAKTARSGTSCPALTRKAARCSAISTQAPWN
jgi:polyphosphate kinase 2 (PPK2 family)